MRYALTPVLGLVLALGCDDSTSSRDPVEGGVGASGTGAAGGTAAGGPAGGPSAGSGGLSSSGGNTTSGGVPSSGGAPSSGGSPADAGPAPDWLSVETLARASGRIVERVFYSSGTGSGSLRIEGQVCRPDDALPHPLILVNHGGFEGLAGDRFDGNIDGDGFCLNGARLGYVIAMSSYRGEDASEGDIEVCHGEVDDVEAMLDVLRAQPYVDADRVGAFGGSHGGCITTALALRVPTLRAAVDFFGPGDLYAQTEWWHAQLDQNEPAPYCAPVLGTSPCAIVHQSLVGTVETAIGGPPSASTREAYAARSPALRLGELKVPMAFFHGADDYFVDIEQSCKKRAALTAAGKPPLAWYLDASLTPRSPADVCGGGFQTAPVPDTASAAAWSGDGPYLFVYEAQGHAMTGAAFTQSTTIAIRFLFAHLE